jgi:hypothetical protein
VISPPGEAQSKNKEWLLFFPPIYRGFSKPNGGAFSQVAEFPVVKLTLNFFCDLRV